MEFTLRRSFSVSSLQETTAEESWKAMLQRVLNRLRTAFNVSSEVSKLQFQKLVRHDGRDLAITSRFVEEMCVALEIGLTDNRLLGRPRAYLQLVKQKGGSICWVGEYKESANARNLPSVGDVLRAFNDVHCLDRNHERTGVKFVASRQRATALQDFIGTKDHAIRSLPAIIVDKRFGRTSPFDASPLASLLVGLARVIELSDDFRWPRTFGQPSAPGTITLYPAWTFSGGGHSRPTSWELPKAKTDDKILESILSSVYAQTELIRWIQPNPDVVFGFRGKQSIKNDLRVATSDESASNEVTSQIQSTNKKSPRQQSQKRPSGPDLASGYFLDSDGFIYRK